MQRIHLNSICCFCINSVHIFLWLRRHPPPWSLPVRACSISLDPDEDKRDTTIFDGLKRYMISEMSADECAHFKTVTLRNLAKRAQSLKSLRPPRGLSFSLQQQRKCLIYCCSITRRRHWCAASTHRHPMNAVSFFFRLDFSFFFVLLLSFQTANIFVVVIFDDI